MSRPPAKKRTTTTRRRPAARQKAPKRAARPQPGVLDQAVAAIPLDEAELRRLFAWGIVALVLAAGIALAVLSGMAGRAGLAMAEGVGRAGFRVEGIEISGINHMDRMTVYAQALDQESRAMPLVDLDAVRNRLIAYPWVQDARVSRRLPDTLMIRIVERQPAAVWQSNGRLILVDASGEALEAARPESLPDLPLVIGDGANLQVASRAQLLANAPALRPMVRAMTWVGNRRWDLLFDTQERLQLPEGEEAAAAALRKFQELDRTQRLLGRGYVGFDMRDPAKLVIRRRTTTGNQGDAPREEHDTTGNAAEA